MISQGSVSRPVSSFSTSRLNCSFGSERALCNQVAQSKSCLSLRASFASSNPFVHPTSFSSLRTCGGRCSWIDIRVVSFPPRFREAPLQKLVEGLQVFQPPVLTRPDFAQ